MKIIPALIVFQFFCLNAASSQQQLISALRDNNIDALHALFLNNPKNAAFLGGPGPITFDLIPGYKKGVGLYISDRNYSLDMIVSEGNIVFWRISFDTITENGPESVKCLDSGINRGLYNNFLSSFKQFYNADFNKHIVFERNIFALKSCGVTGIPQPLCTSMQGYVKEKNTTELTSWLRSGNLERQLYAIEGMRRLNVNLDGTDREIVEFILSGNGKVSTCAGCDISIVSVKDLAMRSIYVDFIEK